MAYLSYFGTALVSGILLIAAVSIIGLSTAGPSWPHFGRFSLFEAPPLMQAFSPADEIALQVGIGHVETLTDPDLNRTLRSIDIRTALEDTARLRGELG